MNYCNRSKIAIYSCAVIVFFAATTSAAVDFQQVQRLRRQGLYRAAERKCLDLLETKLSDSDRAMTLVEYLRTVEVHISTTDARVRDDLITQSQKNVDAYVRKHSDSPYGFLVAIQSAVTRSANARLARFDAEANLSNDGFDSAIVASRSVIRDFEKMREEIGEAKRAANNRTPQKGFSQVQFQRLRNKIDWETAKAWVNLAKCFPDSKKDRISVLAKAIDLTEPLTRLTANPTIATKSRLLDAECRRRTGDANRARQTLVTLAADDSLSPCIRLAVATQQLWLHFDAQQFRDAQMIADKAKSLQCAERQVRAEQAYAVLNLYVELAVQTGDNQVWQLRAAQQVEAIARDFPGYWQRRSEIVYARLRGGSAVASELAKLESQAARAFSEKSFDDSVALFLKAADIAGEKGLQDRVFEFRYRAGAILHQQRKFSEAVEVLRRAACESDPMPDASKAHLLAIVAAAQLVRSGSGGDDVERYGQLLEEHLVRWQSTKATVSQVGWWLGQLRQRQLNFAGALAAYGKIEISFKEYRHVIDAIRVCHAELIEQTNDPRLVPDAIQSGVDQLGSIADECYGANDELGRWAILNAIDLQLLHSSKTADAARRLLEIVAAAQIDNDTLAHAKGNALLVIAYVSQARVANADSLIPKLKTLDHQQVQGLMRRVDQIGQPRTRKEMAVLQLKLYELQEDGDIPDDIRSLFARSLTVVGQFEDAVKVFQGQLQQHPQSVPLRIELATTLQHAKKPQEALQHWRKLAADARPATDAWFLAKYGIAENLAATGNAKDAADAIRVTQALHPSLGGNELKRRFTILLRKCESD